MITAGIATVPPRVNNIERVISSLSGQVDKIYLALNGFYIADELWYPTFLDKYDNIEYFFTDNSKGDAEKFRYADKIEEYYISWDDDLVMYDGCAEYMINLVTKYNAIVTFHGKRYDGERPIPNYKNSFTTNVRCLSAYRGNDIEIHVGGTGCMAFDTKQFKLSLYNFEHRNMADVIVAREAYTQGVKIMAINHPALEYLPPPKGSTIWDTTKSYVIQTQILNSFLK
jgi:hypothetical protein